MLQEMCQPDPNAQWDEHVAGSPSWASSDFCFFPSLVSPSPKKHIGLPKQEFNVPSTGYDRPLPAWLVDGKSQCNPSTSTENITHQTSDTTPSSTEATTSPLALLSSNSLFCSSKLEETIKYEVPDTVYTSETTHSSLPQFLGIGSEFYTSPKLIKTEIAKAENDSQKCNICSRVCKSSKSLRYAQSSVPSNLSHAQQLESTQEI